MFQHSRVDECKSGLERLGWLFVRPVRLCSSNGVVVREEAARCSKARTTIFQGAILICVTVPRNWSSQPALGAEISAVLRWAYRAFGPAGALQDDGEWDYDLEGIAEPDTPLELAYDEGTGDVSLAPATTGQALTTLTLTLSGSSGFCEAFCEAFGVGD